jgi:hypothetical protein
MNAHPADVLLFCPNESDTVPIRQASPLDSRTNDEAFDNIHTQEVRDNHLRGPILHTGRTAAGLSLCSPDSSAKATCEGRIY